MPSRVAPPIRTPHSALAIAAVVLLGGCAPATRGVGTSASVVASAGNTVASLPTAYVESQTVSFALDRIDQRSLPLDQTYRHFGTGSGVTVYVFDGGILDSHPELAGRVRRGFVALPGEGPGCYAPRTPAAVGRAAPPP